MTKKKKKAARRPAKKKVAAKRRPISTSRKKAAARRRKKVAPAPEVKVRVVNPPIHVVDPLRERMEAICTTARALEELAKAIRSSPLNVTISGSVITNSSGHGIQVG